MPYKRDKISVGIDVGQQGAICVMSRRHGVLLLERMPIVEADRKLDLLKLRKIFARIRHICESDVDDKRHIVVIERSQPMPQQGVVSVFSYGRSYGAIEACCVMAKIHPYVTVPPQEWMHALGLKRPMKRKGKGKGKGKGKSKTITDKPSIRYVLQKYGDVDIVANAIHRPVRGIYDGVTDAICIAEYGLNHC